MKARNSEITPEYLYLSRRGFLKRVGLLAAGSLLVSACKSEDGLSKEPELNSSLTPQTRSSMDELGDPLNSYEDITNYNNYYEFSTDKTSVAGLAQDLIISPWSFHSYVKYDLWPSLSMTAGGYPINPLIE